MVAKLNKMTIFAHKLSNYASNYLGGRYGPQTWRLYKE